jgi:enamine deaminase RidA (YjgF/YER057c/UK114 family)
MTTIYRRLHSLGIELPPLPPPVVAGYVPSFASHIRSGDTVYISGRLAKRNGSVWEGKVGDQLTTEEGIQAARGVAIEILSVLHSTLKDLSKVRRIARLFVMVNSTPNFCESHVVANGASELFAAVLGEAGTHARSACGVAQLPFGACVEIEAIVDVVAEQMDVLCEL